MNDFSNVENLVEEQILELYDSILIAGSSGSYACSCGYGGSTFSSSGSCAELSSWYPQYACRWAERCNSRSAYGWMTSCTDK